MDIASQASIVHILMSPNYIATDRWHATRRKAVACTSPRKSSSSTDP